MAVCPAKTSARVEEGESEYWVTFSAPGHGRVAVINSRHVISICVIIDHL